jgi:glc operon protein GlcG
VNPTVRRIAPIAILLLLAAGHAAPRTRADDRKPDPPSAPLVTRERVQLNLAGAEVIVAAAKRKAAEMGLKVNIAVVDDGGHLLAFARMDGARPASGYTALTKAVTAATFRQETGPLPPKGEPDILLNLSLQNAAAASGGKVTTLKGGVPVVIDGQVVGAVGVGGASGEQDAEIGKAGIQSLLAALAKK